ncbi:MAG: hypothetical protein IKF14_13900 [Atopobiaceae bacterium]|nr:hypothetical protein [Atopobiaceae bacterium]
MQNRYTGDIGDFSKLGLLQVLHAAGLSIGLNWYLTPDETHNNDGCHTKSTSSPGTGRPSRAPWTRCSRPAGASTSACCEKATRLHPT